MTETRPDVVDVLLDQHDQIKGLLHDIPAAVGSGKEALFEQLVGLLHRHEAGEQHVVHAAMSRRETADASPGTLGTDGLIAFERVTEEQDATRALNSLSKIGVHHPDFDDRFRDFADAVRAHEAHEEELEFPRMRWEFTEEQLHQMANEVMAVQSMD